MGAQGTLSAVNGGTRTKAYPGSRRCGAGSPEPSSPALSRRTPALPASPTPPAPGNDAGYGYSVAPYGTAYRSALRTTRIRRTTRGGSTLSQRTPALSASPTPPAPATTFILGPLGSFNSHHRRTLERILQEGSAFFQASNPLEVQPPEMTPRGCVLQEQRVWRYPLSGQYAHTPYRRVLGPA
jgi:hypothetical protein